MDLTRPREKKLQYILFVILGLRKIREKLDTLIDGLRGFSSYCYLHSTYNLLGLTFKHWGENGNYSYFDYNSSKNTRRRLFSSNFQSDILFV